MLAGVVAAHKGAAGGGEEAASGVDGLEVGLGLDQGVSAAQAVDLGADVVAVGGDVFGDQLGVVGKDAADSVASFFLAQVLDGAGQSLDNELPSRGLPDPRAPRALPPTFKGALPPRSKSIPPAPQGHCVQPPVASPVLGLQPKQCYNHPVATLARQT